MRRRRPEQAQRAPLLSGGVAWRSRDRQFMGSAGGGRKKAGVKIGESLLGFVEVSDEEQSANLEISGVRPITRSPCASSVARAAVRTFAGQARSRGD